MNCRQGPRIVRFVCAWWWRRVWRPRLNLNGVSPFDAAWNVKQRSESGNVVCYMFYIYIYILWQSCRPNDVQLTTTNHTHHWKSHPKTWRNFGLRLRSFNASNPKYVWVQWWICMLNAVCGLNWFSNWVLNRAENNTTSCFWDTRRYIQKGISKKSSPSCVTSPLRLSR